VDAANLGWHDSPVRSVLIVGSLIWATPVLGQEAEAGDAEMAETGDAEVTEDEADARRMFEAGREAYGAGAFEAAFELFERAYALSPRPQLLYNIGQSADRMRDDEAALTYFERYLEAVPEGPHAAAVRARVLTLREVLARERELGEAIAASASPSPEEDVPLRRKWWLWVTVVSVVGVAALATGLFLRDDDPDATVAPSDFGGVIRALRR